MGKMICLPGVATMLVHAVQVPSGFNTFGDQLEPEAVRHCDQDSGNRRVIRTENQRFQDGFLALIVDANTSIATTKANSSTTG